MFVSGCGFLKKSSWRRFTPLSLGYPPGNPGLDRSTGMYSLTSGHPVIEPSALPPVFRYSKGRLIVPQYFNILTGIRALASGLVMGTRISRSDRKSVV